MVDSNEGVGQLYHILYPGQIFPDEIWSNAFSPYNTLNLVYPDTPSTVQRLRGAVSAHSPVNLTVIDSEGRITGIDPVSGQELNQIPGTFYSGADSEPEFVAFYGVDPATLQTKVHGTGSGDYKLIIHNVACGQR